MKASEIENFEHRARFLKASFPSLSIKLAGSWVWVDGDTKSLKDRLKEHGLKWSKNKEKWYLKGEPCARYGRKGADWSYIAFKYGAEEVTAA